MVVEGVAVQGADVHARVGGGGAQGGAGARQVGFEEHRGDRGVGEGGLEFDAVGDGGFDAGVGCDEAGDGEAVGVRQVRVRVVGGDELAAFFGYGRDGRGHGGVELVEARQVGGRVGPVGGLAVGVDGDQRVADDAHVRLGVVDVVPQVGVDVAVDVLAEDGLGQHVHAGAGLADEAERGLPGNGRERAGGYFDDDVVEVGAFYGGGDGRRGAGGAHAGGRSLVPAERTGVGGEFDALGGEVDGDVGVAGGEDAAAFGGGDVLGRGADGEHGGAFPDAHRGGAGCGAQVGAEVDAVHAGGGEGPAHVLVGVGGQLRGVGVVSACGVEAVGGGEGDLGLPEGRGEVGGGLAGPVDAGGRQVDLRGAGGPHVGAVAPHAHAEPRGVEGSVFDEGEDGGAVLGGLLGDGDGARAGGQVGVERADEGVLLEHEVVGESDVRVGDVAHCAQGGFPRVRVRAVGHHLSDVCAVSGDVAHEVGENAGRGDDAQFTVGCRVGRGRAPRQGRRES